MTAKQIIDLAKKELGTKESPPNSNHVKYNTWFYGKDVQGAAYPWCCAFIAWLFKAEQGLCKKTASCTDLYKWFQARGQLVTKPQPGDLVFFKWNKGGSKITDHIGLVISVSGNVINTIEGNTSTTSQDNGGCVMQRNRYSNIVGYARPKYSGLTHVSNTETKKSYEEIAMEVKAGKWGNQPEREKRLTAAGYDYKKVKELVNKMM